MSENDWKQGFAKSVGVFINGEAIAAPNLRGDQVHDDVFYVVFNAHYEPLSFVLPPVKKGELWEKVLDTCEGGFVHDQGKSTGEKVAVVDGRSVVVLRVVAEKRSP